MRPTLKAAVASINATISKMRKNTAYSNMCTKNCPCSQGKSSPHAYGLFLSTLSRAGGAIDREKATMIKTMMSDIINNTGTENNIFCNATPPYLTYINYHIAFFKTCKLVFFSHYHCIEQTRFFTLSTKETEC